MRLCAWSRSFDGNLRAGDGLGNGDGDRTHGTNALITVLRRWVEAPGGDTHGDSVRLDTGTTQEVSRWAGKLSAWQGTQSDRQEAG